MNEDANTRLVQSGYEKFANGDIAGLLDLFADDIHWSTPQIENAAHTGTRSGKGSVSEFFRLMDSLEEFSRFEPLEFIAQNDKVVVLGELSAKIRDTGRTYETDWVHVFHLHDGKVREFQEFFDTLAVTNAFKKGAAAEA